MYDPIRLEFILTDYCNLNCKGCTHYSPVAPKEFTTIQSLKNNMSHISSFIKKGIKDIYLIGGETLLYPDIIESMIIARKYFPESNIFIFTNGILLPKMTDEFWVHCKKLKIQIAITRYPINFDYDILMDLCNQKGITASVFGDREQKNSFFKFSLDITKSQNKYISHLKCYNRGCITVVDDKIYPCSISACVKHLNNAFGMRFEHLDSDYIYVKDLKSISQLKKLRNKPVPFCSYCINPPVTTNYGRSKRIKEEWMN